MIHLRTDQVFELNHTAARLWELIGEDQDLAQIRERLLLEYEVDEAQLRAEMERILSQLKEEDLVRTVDQDASGVIDDAAG